MFLLPFGLYCTDIYTYIYGDQYQKFGDMFRLKGTIIRPNMTTQYWYIQTVHTLWDPILFTTILTLMFTYKLLADIFKMYYRIYSRNSRTFLTKFLYLNLGCVIYARKRFYVNKSGYTGNFLNIVLKAWITRVNTVYVINAHRYVTVKMPKTLHYVYITSITSCSYNQKII